MSFTMLRVSARNALNPRNFGLERAAILVVALVIALNVLAATGRGKPADAGDVALSADAANAPTSGAPGDLAERPNRQVVKKRVKVSTAPDKPPLPSAQLFQPQKVILDATGVPALDPHRAQPLPIKIDVVARIEESAVAAATTDVGATGSLAAPGMSQPVAQIAQVGRNAPALARRAAAGKAKVRDGENGVAVAETAGSRAKRGEPREVRKAELAKSLTRKSDEVPAASIKVAVARSTSRADPTPGELVLRSLRGDV